MKLKEKLQLRLNRLKNASTRANKLCIINKFMSVAGEKESYDEYDAMKFFDWAEKNYRGSSITQIYQVVKWFYRVMDFDFGGISPCRPNFEDMDNVPLPTEQILDLISCKDSYSKILRGMVAMSTIYGMRAKEIKDIREEDINIDDQRLFVRTAKSGRDTWRWMYIPDEILDVLEDYKGTYAPRCDGLNVYPYFHKACRIAGIKGLPRRSGWHMIRRRLIVDLTKTGLPDNIIVRFMRWKRKDALSSILYRYRQSEPDEEMIESIDKKVMEVHPFLRAWGQTDV